MTYLDGGGDQVKDGDGYFYETQSSQEQDSVVFGSEVVRSDTQHKGHLTERTPYDIF